MTDALEIRVVGADRQPILDRFDLDVLAWRSRTNVASVRDHAGAVSVPSRALMAMETYQVQVYPLRHRPVTRAVFGHQHAVDVCCPIDPRRVSSVAWPACYPAGLTRILSAEQVGELGSIARAGLLNIYAKLAQADLWRDVLQVTQVHGDRVFAVVASDLHARLEHSPHFEPVNGCLHEPPLGFDHAGSYKERGVASGVLQVTLFSDGTAYRADIDIDDAGGVGHAFQVMDHWITGSETHPYDIHQLLTLQGLDPGYRLVV